MNPADEDVDRMPEPALPKALGDELRRLYASPIPVPRAVDERVLAEARRRLARAEARPRLVRWVGRVSATVAAAAAVLLALRILPQQPQALPPGPQIARVRAEDLDGNGRVDILDAFLLARRLRGPEPCDRSFDVTGDGVVDGKDVDRVAGAAVEVPADWTRDR
ncbi:MAG: hypothetical protein HYZ53_05245 [Planctomycetes bacterium]|nr:hypothetical protein [Planctomycetota bacterium]